MGYFYSMARFAYLGYLKYLARFLFLGYFTIMARFHFLGYLKFMARFAPVGYLVYMARFHVLQISTSSSRYQFRLEKCLENLEYPKFSDLHNAAKVVYD